MGGVVACRIILSAPVPFPFLWTLDFGFGTWIWDWTWAWQQDLPVMRLLLNQQSSYSIIQHHSALMTDNCWLMTGLKTDRYTHRQRNDKVTYWAPYRSQKLKLVISLGMSRSEFTEWQSDNLSSNVKILRLAWEMTPWLMRNMKIMIINTQNIIWITSQNSFLIF